jgi:hypothetical protein
MGVILGLVTARVEASVAFPTASAPAEPAATQPDAATTEPATDIPNPIFATVFLRSASGEMIKGDVVSFDANTVTIKTFKGPLSHKWTELTTSSACTLRARLVDKTKADEWFTFATFAWGMGGLDQARAAVGQTLALDKTYKPKTDALLKSPPGELIKPAPKPTSTADGTGDAPTTPVTGHEGELFPQVSGTKPKSSRSR